MDKENNAYSCSRCYIRSRHSYRTDQHIFGRCPSIKIIGTYKAGSTEYAQCRQLRHGTKSDMPFYCIFSFSGLKSYPSGYDAPEEKPRNFF